MIQKFLNSQSKSISTASLILAVSYFLSAFLGLFRDRLLAGTFATNLDAYYVAFTVPDFVALVLVFGAISSAIIPMFSSYLIKGKDEAWQYISRIFNILLGILIIICLILMVFTPIVISLVAPGFSGEKRELAINLMRIMFLSPIIFGASNIISGVLQVFHRFIATAIAPILYNLGIIIGIFFFAPKWGLVGLAWGVVLGAVMHLLIQLPSFLFSGFKYKFNFNFKDDGVLKTIKLMAPRSLGLGAGHLNVIATTAIASTLMSGSITVFNYASNLSLIFLNIIAGSISTAAFPAMSMSYLKESSTEFLKKFSKIISQILFMLIPIALTVIILRAQMVRVIYGAGKFGWTDTKLVTACLGILALNLIAQTLILFLSKTFHASQNTKIPAFISIFAVIFNIFLSLSLVWLVKAFPGFNYFLQDIFRLGGVENIGVIVLALSFTMSSLLQCIILVFMFYKKFPLLDLREIIISLKKILLASLVTGVAIFFVRQFIGSFIILQSFWAVLFQLIISGFIGVVVYIFTTHLLKSPENTFIKDSFLKFFTNKILIK